MMNIWIYAGIGLLLAAVFNLTARVFLAKDSIKDSGDKVFLTVMSCLFGLMWIVALPVIVTFLLLYWLSKKSDLLVESLRFKIHGKE